MTFSKQELESLEDRIRRVCDNAKLEAASEGRYLLLSGKSLPIVAVTAAVADMRRTGGLLIWERDNSTKDLALNFELFIRSAFYGTPIVNADMKTIADAKTVLLIIGNSVLFGFYFGSKPDFVPLKPFLRRVRRAGNWSFMTDAKDQLAYLDQAFQDAKALVDRYVGPRRRALRDEVTEAIIFLLNEGAADRPIKIAHVVQLARGELTDSGKRQKKKHQLPPLPPGYRWPSEKFRGSPEAGKHGGLIAYLERVWQPLLAAGLVDRPLLKSIDPTAARAIEVFLYNNGGEQRSLPAHLSVPTKFNRAPSRSRPKTRGRSSAVEA